MIFKKIKVKRFILGNSSRKDEPNGAWVNATGTLTPISWHQGRFFIQLNFDVLFFDCFQILLPIAFQKNQFLGLTVVGWQETS